MADSNDDNNKRDEELPGYPSNPPSDDIFRKYVKEEDINPENPFEEKTSDELATDEFSEELTPDDLDVPGSELDDDMESIGNEDEENNYYSLGGDEYEN